MGEGDSELAAARDSTWNMIAGALNRWTAADLEEICSLPSGLSEEEQQLFRGKPWIYGMM
jgi:hypothetical protein